MGAKCAENKSEIPTERDRERKAAGKLAVLVLPMIKTFSLINRSAKAHIPHTKLRREPGPSVFWKSCQ